MGNRHGIGHRQSNQSGSQVVLAQDGKDCGTKYNKVAEKFKPYSKPSVSHHRIIIWVLMDIHKFFLLFDELCLKMKSSGKK